MSLRLKFVLFLFIISIRTYSQEITQAKLGKIDALFHSYFSKEKPGAIFSILKNGQKIFQKSQGLANIEYQIPINNTTRFNIASVSKQFTAYLGLLLEEEGKLSFDDDIRDYLPELSHLPHKITITQLVNHTHGLSNPDELAQLSGKNFMDHKDIVAMLLKIKKPTFLPGNKFEYNNTGYILFSEIIERIEKTPFEEQLKKRIFLPLGMHNTYAVKYTSNIIKNKAFSYQEHNGDFIQQPVKLSTIGSSGIYTSMHDLSIWANNYHKIKLGKGVFYNKMEEITITNSQVKTNYGLGLHKDIYKGIEIVFHGGGTESYRSYILHVPSHKLSFVFLSNAGGMTGLDVVYKSLEIVLSEELTEPTSNSNKANLKDFEGTYEIYPGYYYNFIVEKGKLCWQQFGNDAKTPLTALANNTYEFPYIPHSKFVFHKNRMVFHIADIARYCKKVSIKKPLNQININLTKYVGHYKNEELNTIYELKVIDNELVAKHNSNNIILLKILKEDNFYTNEYYFGKVDFNINDNEEVIGFKVSAQSLNEIEFKKIN
ncbi:CubicO group peptidase, beta-lactamase class C family [Tenacibaculum sp. MAR_2009_124]|uniref:serine hydrolase domain-containing protein n=1 Tax=Tenacibaculum sp. MAR_2009_124 TaxID=1250059 RepID=UPI0008981982|nr:serine hydrolase domain-containing protein [Tenacibaculum sp. MAR_2009_124]SED06756.1 CubicO group peptidase, beta-lactamase class C family [Tenacibaculum sp. MAR_2009_124]